MASDDCDPMDGANVDDSDDVDESEVSDRAASCNREGQSELSSAWMMSLATGR